MDRRNVIQRGRPARPHSREVVRALVPERSPGFIGNISQCCGNCGVSEYFVARHAFTRNGAALAFAERTGLVQGAAGVGLAMPHVNGAISGRRGVVVLPDDPFV